MYAPSFQLGDIPCEWIRDDHEASGVCTLAPNAHTTGQLFEPTESDSGPVTEQQEILRGRLRSGLDVVLTGVHITYLMPERGEIGAGLALVGRSLVDVALEFDEVVFQVEGTDDFSGTAPILDTFEPKAMSGRSGVSTQMELGLDTGVDGWRGFA